MSKPERLRSWKYRHNLTNERIARKLGFSSSYIGRVFYGGMRPSEHFVQRFIEIYGQAGAHEAGLVEEGIS